VVLTIIGEHGGKCPTDERCMDLAEALDRYIQDALR